MTTATALALKQHSIVPRWISTFARKIAGGFVRAYHWLFGAPKPLSSRERRQQRKAKVREAMKGR